MGVVVSTPVQTSGLTRACRSPEGAPVVTVTVMEPGADDTGAIHIAHWPLAPVAALFAQATRANVRLPVFEIDGAVGLAVEVFPVQLTTTTEPAGGEKAVETTVVVAPLVWEAPVGVEASRAITTYHPS